MAASTGVSLVLSSVFSVLLFSSMQLYKPWFISSQANTILGGFLGSWIFVFLLTSISNFESLVLGNGFQAKLFPEVFISIVIAMFASGMVHPVCGTSCILFSFIALFFLNRVSQRINGTVETVSAIKKKRK